MAGFQTGHSQCWLYSHLIPRGTLVHFSVLMYTNLLSDLVIRLSALRRDPLVCASLSFWDVDGARDPASNQLKTFSLEALGPEGPCLVCWSCHGLPED